jgi:hypothetical protein
VQLVAQGQLRVTGRDNTEEHSNVCQTAKDRTTCINVTCFLLLLFAANCLMILQYQQKTEAKTKRKDKNKRQEEKTNHNRDPNPTRQTRQGTSKKNEHAGRRKAKSKNKGKLHLKNDVILVRNKA